MMFQDDYPGWWVVALSVAAFCYVALMLLTFRSYGSCRAERAGCNLLG